MQFALTEEQEALRNVTRRFLEQRSPEAVVREMMRDPKGGSRTLWKRMADEVGLQGLSLPEQFGGGGATFREVSVVMGELGRSVASVPYLSTVCLAVPAIVTSGDEQAMSGWLPGIASGDVIATVAYLEGDKPFDLSPELGTVARGSTLTGTKRYVLDGAAADLILVLAATDEGPTLFAVDAGSGPVGFTATPLPTMDQTRRQADLTFQDTPAVQIGAAGSGLPLLRSAFDHGFVGIAAECVGGAERCLEMAVEYAKVRVQFGRPIGSFQAIKHRCADNYVELELAGATATFAAQQLADGADEAPVLASVAKSFCAEMYLRAAKDNIQIHGGIGYTWDHPAHLYLKRAKTNQILLGDTALQHRRVGQLIGLG